MISCPNLSRWLVRLKIYAWLLVRERSTLYPPTIHFLLHDYSARILDSSLLGEVKTDTISLARATCPVLSSVITAVTHSRQHVIQKSPSLLKFSCLTCMYTTILIRPVSSKPVEYLTQRKIPRTHLRSIVS
jgi:hypothetical protein